MDKSPENTPKTPKKHEKTPKNTNKSLILKNRNHEIFAQKLVDPKVSSPAEAYAIAYPGVKQSTCSSNSSQLLKNASIRERVLELLESNKSTNMKRLTEKLGEHVESEEGHLSLKAVELGWKLHGALELDNANASEPADININIIANSNVNNDLRKDAT